MALDVKYQATVKSQTQDLAYETEAGAVEGLDEAISAEAAENTGTAAYTSPDPTYFERFSLMTVSKTSVTIPAGMSLKINGTGYALFENKTVSLSSVGSASARAGKDVYVYAVPDAEDNLLLDIVLSLNSTVPSGYTAENSRKIGGFHCLCIDVGTIENHPLSGYVQGDILPASVWDLKHRPHSNPEGMVYDEQINRWVDIYLASYDAGEGLVSVYGGVIADGASSPKFHCLKFGQYFNQVKKHMPNLYEFESFSHGANQGTNISGSADPTTTGGHIDTANRRMISDIGCEDTCGVLTQWSRDRGGPYADAKWVNGYDDNDDADVKGSSYNAPNCERLGGAWDDSSYCGSRYSCWSRGPLYLAAHFGARGLAEPNCP